MHGKMPVLSWLLIISGTICASAGPLSYYLFLGGPLGSSLLAASILAAIYLGIVALLYWWIH